MAAWIVGSVDYRRRQPSDRPGRNQSRL